MSRAIYNNQRDEIKRDDEKWDKEQQHLDDHHHDLWLEEAMLTCEHEDYTIRGIDDATYSSLRIEFSCDFCERAGMKWIGVEKIHDLIHNSILTDNDIEWDDE